MTYGSWITLDNDIFIITPEYILKAETDKKALFNIKCPWFDYFGKGNDKTAGSKLVLTMVPKLKLSSSTVSSNTSPKYI